jgi:hypothetical protein
VAFDVFVGTMTRFYRRDWENVVQRMAREQGTPYKMIYAGGEPEVPVPADEMREAVMDWCKGLSNALQSQGCGPVEWDEADERPYFTARPAWRGYSALLVWAAHAEHPDLPLPTEAPESWADDPAFQRSTVREFKSRYGTILEPQVWLPTKFPFVFGGPTLASEETCIGSVFTLKEQLDELYQQTAVHLQSLKDAEMSVTGPAKKQTFFKRLWSRKTTEPSPAKPALAAVAKFGLSVFRDLAAKACEHRLPILLHY